MQAIGIEHFGDQPHLISVPVPDPDDGEVEVELFAASKNPLDGAVAAGYLAGLGDYRFPLVLGFDGAGVVRRVGGGTGFAVGDRVFGQFWSVPMQFGTYAEVALVQARPALGALARVPDGIGFAEAAASPTAGMTAAGAIEASGATTGDAILILGATGGLGTFAVQEAAALGMHVVASAGEQAVSALRELGARHVLPRDAGPLADALKQLGIPLAAVLDFAGSAEASAAAIGAIRDGGALISTAHGIPDALHPDKRLRGVDYTVDRKPERLDALATRLNEGTIRPVIGTQLGLPDALTTTGASSGGLRGKTVIHIRS
jgi:NADPH:quinone reductase-like Zn-dependent oxidoreductase